ncbi:MAG: C10 family peptidase [Saprospiraceae bacterium]|nr:C10 family peptidase [Saprospiraceae bacterium]
MALDFILITVLLTERSLLTLHQRPIIGIQCPNTIQGLKRINYSDAAWINLLKTDLNNGRPIQYAGFGPSGGHTFVCDGYDVNSFFHMNWGWGGQADGYFNFEALNPGGTSFNSNQQALIGIQPLTGGGNQTNILLNSSVTLAGSKLIFIRVLLSADFYNAGTTNFSGDFVLPFSMQMGFY